MLGSLRVIFELLADPGSDPEAQIDTDELAPPKFDDLIGLTQQVLQIGPSAVDTAVTIVDSCLLLILSDEPILLKLASGETEQRTRMFLAAAEDSGHTAVPATTLLLSGNTASTATVRIYSLAVVT